MGSTVIRVDQRTRDRLAALAEQDHRTLGEQVAHLVEREHMAREFHAAYEQLMADADAWADYVHERDQWLDAVLGRLADASRRGVLGVQRVTAADALYVADLGGAVGHEQRGIRQGCPSRTRPSPRPAFCSPFR